MRKKGSKNDKIHHDLNRLVDYQFSILEFGWAPRSILHRVSTEGHVDRGRPGPTILCPDMPGDLAGVQRAFLALTSAEKHIITVKYMPYTVYDFAQKSFKKALDKDRARFVGIKYSTFTRRYNRAAKKAKRFLTRG